MIILVLLLIILLTLGLLWKAKGGEWLRAKLCCKKSEKIGSVKLDETDREKNETDNDNKADVYADPKPIE